VAVRLLRRTLWIAGTLAFATQSRSSPAQETGRPDFGGLTADEQQMVDNACSQQRYLEGPAAYNQCARRQIDGLRHGPARPDFAGLTVDERQMVDNACSQQRYLEGPAAYNRCARRQVDSLRQGSARPDFTGLTVDERQMVDNACSQPRYLEGPAAYNQCARQQLATLRQNPARPDFRGLASNERQMVDSACSQQRYLQGPAAYNQCALSQVRRLGRAFKTPPEQTILNPPLTTPPKHSVGAIQGGSRILQPASPSITNSSPPRPKEPRAARARPGGATVRPPEAPILPTILFTGFIGYVAWTAIRYATTKTCTVCRTQRTRNTSGVCFACEGRRRAEEQEAQRREEGRAAEESSRRAEEERRRRIRTLDDLHRMSGSEFEAFVASLFKRDGYQVKACGGACDDGIDLVLGLGQTIDVVQCKRWRADIGSAVVRDFYGALMHAGARHGFVITTASFTDAARKFAANKPITLIDGNRLLGWISGVGGASEQETRRRGEETRRRRQQRTAEDEARRRAESERRESRQSRQAPTTFDPYAVLGVQRGASRDEIREAYKRVVQQYHPDKVAHLGRELQQLALEKTKEINRAYEVLLTS